MSETTDDSILIHREPPLGWIVFNRPEKRNAMNAAMWKALPEAIHALEEDSEVRVIVFRGAGEVAFSAGADIEEFSAAQEASEQSAVRSGTTGGALESIAECRKPTVGMIHGACFGGGCAMALNMDIRLASADARFAITPARLGLGYPFEGVERAVQELGPANARYLFLTAKAVDAERALDLGVVQEVHAGDALEGATCKLAETISGNAPMTVRAIRESVRQSLLGESERDVAQVRALIQECFDSEDYREGVRAFLEKRRPDFRDA